MKNKYLIHIPHSSKNIPDKFLTDYKCGLEHINKIKETYTDIYTDEIFKPLLIKSSFVISKYSRVLFDVERFFDDKLEEMSKRGLGWFYTKSLIDGRDIRSKENKKNMKDIESLYKKHHLELDEKVDFILEKYNECTIIDCHSFTPDRDFFKLQEGKKIPDICIGFEEETKDDNLINIIKEVFSDYYIEFNFPYTGSLISNKHYGKDKRVKSVMIELNKDIYMDKNLILKDEEKFSFLVDKILLLSMKINH
jgi:N-formylglutamate amidohydrolase